MSEKVEQLKLERKISAE